MTIDPVTSKDETASSLRQRVRSTIAKAIPKISHLKIEDHTSLFDLGIDSLDHAKLLIALEDELGIVIEDEEINTLTSIDALTHHCGILRGRC
ncbi:MAG: acyl carrier protein [Cyanobium sp.]